MQCTGAAIVVDDDDDDDEVQEEGKGQAGKAEGAKGSGSRFRQTA